MKTEVEAKFLRIDVGDIRARLKGAGAACEQPMRLMRRVIINTPKMAKNNGYLRVRDEGDKVTVTYKQFDALSVDGAREIELTVSSFDDTVALLVAAGLSQASFQESRRETWQLGEVEVVIDEWPWLEPYIEIEGGDEVAIRDVAAILGLDWSDAVFGDVMVAYRAQYPNLTTKDSVGDIANVRFSDPTPAHFKV